MRAPTTDVVVITKTTPASCTDAVRTLPLADRSRLIATAQRSGPDEVVAQVRCRFDGVIIVIPIRKFDVCEWFPHLPWCDGNVVAPGPVERA